ncbi:MAG TPA: NB-ARC domain-containing protein [Thermoanaerobaculia bacterium]|nr:NB-ARC domain-containing protein [Thermoanaerobaculia bacterium]
MGNELDERAKRFPDLVEEFFQIPVEDAKPSFSETVSGVTSVPNPPVHYLAREDALAELRAKLLAPGSTRLGITSPRHAVGIQGMGGIGKSVLAAVLAQEEEVKAAFPDGIFWVAVGQQADLRRLQIELATAAGEASSIIESIHQGKLLLSRLLAERAVLVVLDDLWNLDDAAAFNVLGPRGRLLVTTRHSDLLVGLGAEEFRVEVLTPKAALGLLADWAGDRIDRLLPEAATVARRCGYLPLALAMIGAMVRLRPTAWSDALERLDHSDLK